MNKYILASQDFNFPKNIFKVPQNCLAWRKFFFKVRSLTKNNEDYTYCKYWGIDQLYPLTYESSSGKANQEQISIFYYLTIYFFKKQMIKKSIKKYKYPLPIF